MQNYDRIQAYLSDELSVAERQAFEQALANDTALRQEYDAHLATEKAMEVLGFDKMEEELAALRIEAEAADTKEANKEEKEPKNNPEISEKEGSGRAWWKWIFALVLIGLLGFLAWYWMHEKHSNRALAETYYELPVASSILRNTSKTAVKEGAYLALTEGNYDRAERLLTENNTNSLDVESLLLLGVIQYENGQEKVAFETFETIKKETVKTTEEQRVDALWYQTFVALKMGKEQQAIQNLNEIIENSITTAATKKQATELLADLNSIWR